MAQLLPVKNPLCHAFTWQAHAHCFKKGFASHNIAGSAAGQLGFQTLMHAQSATVVGLLPAVNDIKLPPHWQAQHATGMIFEHVLQVCLASSVRIQDIQS